jgi:hypothetical protein
MRAQLVLRIEQTCSIAFSSLPFAQLGISSHASLAFDKGAEPGGSDREKSDQ